ncbi:MAG: 2-octaprenyl-3-methyl-6-methoxy-1,4-benzoquinol hydroxylase, partial [Pseudomonadota bacterium]|nr:2-octaprenyl-3-methyl-6-methoxy-1,4-benzoquinol hydroxylase [Pseudomonadota bacterium]
MPAFDVFVRGSGAVGKCLALALCQQGLDVAWRVPPDAPRGEDLRAFALNAGAVELLRRLRVWSSLPDDAKVGVHEMQVRGDAPGAALEFTAWQQRVGELAVIVDAAALDRQLDAALAYASRLVRTADDVEASLVAHCEGADAASRAGADTGFVRSAYGQTAIAARVVASLPHRHTAWQWFRSPDVLALLPFDRPTPGRSFALVWSLPAARAETLAAASPSEFAAALD